MPCRKTVPPRAVLKTASPSTAQRSVSTKREAGAGPLEQPEGQHDRRHDHAVRDEHGAAVDVRAERLGDQEEDREQHPGRKAERDTEGRHPQRWVHETGSQHDDDAGHGKRKRHDHDRLGALPEQTRRDKGDVDGGHVGEEHGQRDVEVTQRQHERVELHGVEQTEREQARPHPWLARLPHPSRRPAEQRDHHGGQGHAHAEHRARRKVGHTDPHSRGAEHDGRAADHGVAFEPVRAAAHGAGSRDVAPSSSCSPSSTTSSPAITMRAPPITVHSEMPWPSSSSAYSGAETGSR